MESTYARYSYTITSAVRDLVTKRYSSYPVVDFRLSNNLIFTDVYKLRMNKWYHCRKDGRITHRALRHQALIGKLGVIKISRNERHSV